MNRREAIAILMRHVPADALVVAANGYISRELFSSADREGNFYMLGSMGMCLPISLGLSRVVRGRKIVALDGDGNLLMSLGSMATAASLKPDNLVHVVLDNEAYESTGGQPSSSKSIDLAKLAEACGYSFVGTAEDPIELESKAAQAMAHNGAAFLLIKLREPMSPPPRVSIAPEEIAKRFRKALGRASRQ